MARLRIVITALTLVLTACTESPTDPTGLEPQFGRNVDTDSRAIWTWADSYSSGTDALGNPISAPTMIRSDGRGAYQGDVCGVHAKIFWYNTSLSRSGDAVFDPDFNRSGSCAARKLHFYLNGQTASALGTFTNAREVMQLAVGESRVQQMGFSYTGIRNCDQLRFLVETGGVRVTRLDANTDPTAARSWRVESVAPHKATCMVSQKGQTVPSSASYTLPFSVTIQEVK